MFSVLLREKHLPQSAGHPKASRPCVPEGPENACRVTVQLEEQGAGQGTPAHEQDERWRLQSVSKGGSDGMIGGLEGDVTCVFEIEAEEAEIESVVGGPSASTTIDAKTEGARAGDGKGGAEGTGVAAGDVPREPARRPTPYSTSASPAPDPAVDCQLEWATALEDSPPEPLQPLQPPHLPRAPGNNLASLPTRCIK